MSFVRAAEALSSHGPVARTSDLIARGVTKREIARACRNGEIIRVRTGVYADIGAAAEVIHAAEHGGAIGCSTAGRMHGLWNLDPDDDSSGLHVWHGRASALRECAHPGCADTLRVHWDAGVPTLGALPPVRNVLLQIAVCAGEEPFFVALESALRKALLPPGSLRWLSRRLPPELRWLLSFARSDADSGLESLIRLRLHHAGIPVRTQVFIAGVGEVDLLIGDHLIIEADGKKNHEDAVDSPRSLRHKDLLRDARAAALGYETLRFDYALIVHDWPTVLAAILARLDAIRKAG